jgi:predicted RNase H-like nuclease
MLGAIDGLEGWDAPRDLTDRWCEIAASAKGSGLKSVEDPLDAAISVTCVYAHWIYDGKSTQLVGEEEHGFVYLPAKRNQDER